MLFLFGAGASKPAQIPDINDMTKTFLSDPLRLADPDVKKKAHNDLKIDLEVLKGVTESYYGKVDLEFLMSLILQLGEKNFSDVITSKHEGIKKISQSNLDFLRVLINEYIRKECERIDLHSMEFLWPLAGLIDDDRPLLIFTLNYDGLVEAFCESNDLSYSDGFGPYWDPENFSGNKVNVYKLHGSLYWFKTASGKMLRVPIKGMNLDKMKHLTDEPLSEIMIYPALQKNKQSQVYLWLHNKFLEELKKTDTCVIVGYSFRDEDIRNAIIDSLKVNKKLWLIVISPNSLQRREEFFKNEDEEITSRIFCINKSVEEVVRDRKIKRYIDTLGYARTNEKSMWDSLALDHTIDKSKVNAVVSGYRHVGPDSIPHDIRIQWIRNKFNQRKINVDF
jgi:hypothetical protein